MKNEEFYVTHDVNFSDMLEGLFNNSYENEKNNRRQKIKRATGTGRHKKSPHQNGNAAVASLLTFIILESSIRRRFYFLGKDKTLTHDENIEKLINKLCPKITELNFIVDYVKEATLVRDLIAHAYLFKGRIAYSKDYELIALKELPVSGRKIAEFLKTTKVLKMRAAPMQISFNDAAKMYYVYAIVMRACGMQEQHDLWKWEDGKYIEPTKWIQKAICKLQYNKSSVWKNLLQQYDNLVYSEYL